MIYYDEVKVMFDRDTYQLLQQIALKSDMTISHFVKMSTLYAIDQIKKEAESKEVKSGTAK